MNYDLTDFRIFTNIAEESNLTRGAARSFLSVPATSQRIKNLEESLKVKLLQRTTQGVSLTEAGKAYLLYAHKVLGNLELLSSELQAFGAGVKGHLKVHANTTAITEFLPPVLKEYLGLHPNVQIDLRERLSDEAVRAVREGAADLGIISGSVPADNLELQRFATSRLVVIAPAGHAVLKQESVRFKELLGYEFVALLDGSATQEFLRQHALKVHGSIKVRVQVAGFDAIVRLVESGVGLGIVPEMVVTRLNTLGTIGICTLAEPWAGRDYYLCAKEFASLPLFAREFATSVLLRYQQSA
ncbi:LysR family transcriptional regulator [Acidovorax sp. D2M1]|uniref:LysR family transcriptional regulator n=1 Tax=Acidovorax benzenivorans TaxID=2987520 RepID=A0ABT5S012_9BURK|nr:LysR family transcriptional regulator [Acidovorax benzenivorans]MDD2179280.1 LysR family transcriptional regulator [Acidovorax benzenivorans]